MFQFSTQLNLDRITMNNLIKQGTTMSNKSSNKSVGSNIEQTQIFLLVGSAVWLLTSTSSGISFFFKDIGFLLVSWLSVSPLRLFAVVGIAKIFSFVASIFLKNLLFDFVVSGRFLKLYFFIEFKFYNHRRSWKLFFIRSYCLRLSCSSDVLGFFYYFLN